MSPATLRKTAVGLYLRLHHVPNYMESGSLPDEETIATRAGELERVNSGLKQSYGSEPKPG